MIAFVCFPLLVRCLSRLTLREDPSLGVSSEATVPNIEGYKRQMNVH